MSAKPTIVAIKQDGIEPAHVQAIIAEFVAIGYTNILVYTEEEAKKVYDDNTMDMLIFKDYPQVLDFIPIIAKQKNYKRKQVQSAEKRASWKKKMQGLTNRKILLNENKEPRSKIQEEPEFDHEKEVIDTECPNCGAIWNVREMDLQECNVCKYPLIEL